MNDMLLPLRRYAEFSGRSRRTEFWLFILFQWLVYFGAIVLAVLFGATLGSLGAVIDPNAGAVAGGIGVILLFAFIIIFWLAMLIPNLAVAARRMQDQDIPGVVGVLLVIGGWFLTFPFLIMAVFGCIGGTRGPNRYGKDPKPDGIADTFR